MSAATIRWPRLLTPTHLAYLIRQQKSPDAALDLFNRAPLLYPTTYRHTPAVHSALLESLSSSPPHLPLFLSHLHHLLLSSPSSSPSLDSLLSRFIPSLPLPLPSSIPPNFPLSFHSLLRTLIQRKRLPDALCLLRQASPSNLRLPSLNLIIGALCDLDRPDLALQIFADLSKHCFSPDRHTYRLLMIGLCRADRLDDALHLLYAMLRRISQRGCDTDVVAYRALLYALCRSGRFGDAEHALSKVLIKGLRTPKRRRAFQRPQLAGLALDEMERRIDEALASGGVRSLKSYSALIEDLYSEGKFEDAQKMFDEMTSRGFRPGVSLFEKKIEGLCREERVEDGVRVLEVEMRDMNCVASVRCYDFVIQGLCLRGESRRAVEYLEMMERRDGCVAKRVTFETLVRGLVSEGRFVEASDVLERMARRKYWAGREVYNEVVQGLCCVGRRYEALLCFEEMLSQGKLPDVDLWSSLVSIVCVDFDSIKLVSCLKALADYHLEN